MDKIEFNAHLQTVISFLRTLVIKVEAIGITDNQLLERNGYPVSTNKREWRYYLNMSGEYHNTDTPMVVTSIDNGEKILFSKESLKIHLATKRSYQPGEYWYQRLTEEYPGQIDLIHGILDPIDMESAIAAPDYKILRFNKRLLNHNEDQLIPEIQDWINSYAHKHLINDYGYTEDLNLPVELATIYGLLVPLILIIRLEAYGTRYIHDYHIWSKLNSFGNFTPYKGSLNHKQKMWLYRNILYIRSNLGKNFTLEELIENLLTPEGIPIYHYRSVVDVKDVTPLSSFSTLNGPVTDPKPLNGVQPSKRPTSVLDSPVDDYLFDGNVNTFSHYTPKKVNREFTIDKSFQKVRLNFTELDQDTGLRYSNEDLLRLENNLALDNLTLFDQHVLESKEESDKLLFSSTGTKLLDSTMEDYTNRHSDTLMKTLYHQWIYQTHHNLYESIIEISDPLTGNRTRLNTRDALLYWDLLVKRYRGDATDHFTGFYYQYVLTKELRPKEDFITGSDFYLPNVVVDDVRTLWFPTAKSVSPDKFFEQSFQVYDLKWKTKKLYSQYQDTMRHAIVKECTERLYTSGEVLIHDTELYPSVGYWLNQKELKLDQYSPNELLMLAWEIFSKSTGWDVYGIISLREIQSNLINLMLELSSYTIQFIKDMNDGNMVAEAGDCVHLGFGNNTLSNVGDFLLPPKLPLHIRTIPSLPEMVMESSLPFPLEEVSYWGTAYDKVSTSSSIEFKETILSSGADIKAPVFINLIERFE